MGIILFLGCSTDYKKTAVAEVIDIKHIQPERGLHSSPAPDKWVVSIEFVIPSESSTGTTYLFRTKTYSSKPPYSLHDKIMVDYEYPNGDFSKEPKIDIRW